MKKEYEMAKFGGFMGGGNNMQAMLRQAQKMQEEALKAQAEVDESEVEGSASGNLVKVVMKGNKEVVSLTIDKSIVDPDDVEMLEDMVVAALNDASSKADQLRAQKLGRFGGGLM